MRRREFLALNGAVAVGSLARPAQSQGMPVVGYLSPESPRPFASRVRAFREGLAGIGYVEGRNVIVEFRWAEGHYDKLPGLAADLVNQQVAVIVAPGGAPVALAAKSATTTVPIVFEMGGDPIALGVVGSLSRPDGNVTGISSLSVEASLKRLELLCEVIRNHRNAEGTESLMIVGAVANPTSPTAASQIKNLQIAADALGVQLPVLNVSTEEQFEPLFETLVQRRAMGLVFTSDPFFAFRSEHLAAIAARYSMPAIQQSRDFTIAGGLMSYGGDFAESHRLSGVYTGRLLKGAKPSDLPVQRVTKLELLINLNTARRFGIAFPLLLLGRADEVIE
jgi:putative ABC transport system substrate-binding protein